MKTIALISFFTFFLILTGFSQTKSSLEFRVEKQAMSTPMSNLEDMFFINYYISKPVNVKFDGTSLNMTFDNGGTFVKKNVTEVDRNAEYEDNNIILETILYTDNSNASDTISLVVDYAVGYVQIVLPTKNSKGEYVGYTSYKNFDKSIIKETSLALN